MAELLRKLVGFLRLYPRLRLTGASVAGTPMAFGRRPVLVGGGTIEVGAALRIRARQFPALVGAAPGGRLVLGDDVYLNQGVNLVAHHEIVVGDRTRLADLATVYDVDHHDLDASTPARVGAVRIGRDVWIGRNALVLPGVTIGDGAVVAAGSIVTDDVPAATVVAGVPARAVRTLDVPPGWTRD